MLEGGRESEAVAYDAGLFDGEGSLFINHNSGRYEHWVVRCTMTLTHRASLERFRSRYGGNLTTRGVYGRLGKKPCWQWSITGRNAVAFLARVGPLLVIKRPEYDVVRIWDGRDGADAQSRVRLARAGGV